MELLSVVHIVRERGKDGKLPGSILAECMLPFVGELLRLVNMKSYAVRNIYNDCKRIQ